MKPDAPLYLAAAVLAVLGIALRALRRRRIVHSKNHRR